MNIQPITMFSCRKSQFTGTKKRVENTDRVATVQDLYEMEDRIKTQNAILFSKQNKLIGKTLDSIASLAYLSPSEADSEETDKEFDNAIDNARILIHNGKN